MPPLRPYLLRVDYRFGALDDPDARARVAGVVEQALRGIGVRDSEIAVKLQHLPEGATPRRVVLETPARRGTLSPWKKIGSATPRTPAP